MTDTRPPFRWRPKLLVLVSLVVTWLLWSGIYKSLLLMLGAFSCLLTLWLVRRMNYFNEHFDEEVFTPRFIKRLLKYWRWLAEEIIRSSFDVARIVLDPKLPISPRFVDIKSESPHTFEQVLLGNSITLTPGTLSVDVFEGVIKVHSLTEDGAKDLVSGEMNRRVNELRKG